MEIVAEKTEIDSIDIENNETDKNNETDIGIEIKANKGIEIELDKDKITGESRSLNISYLCEACTNRRVCDFIRDVKSFFRDRKSIKCITDAEITVYSCNGYEQETYNVSDNDNVCVYCKEN